MWLEYGETPLRWQLPVGVVFDLLAGAEAEARCCGATVRFQRFLAEEVASGAAADAEATLLNALKGVRAVRLGAAGDDAPELTQKLVAAVVPAATTPSRCAPRCGAAPRPAPRRQQQRRR